MKQIRRATAYTAQVMCFGTNGVDAISSAYTSAQISVLKSGTTANIAALGGQSTIHTGGGCHLVPLATGDVNVLGELKVWCAAGSTAQAPAYAEYDIIPEITWDMLYGAETSRLSALQTTGFAAIPSNQLVALSTTQLGGIANDGTGMLSLKNLVLAAVDGTDAVSISANNGGNAVNIGVNGTGTGLLVESSGNGPAMKINGDTALEIARILLRAQNGTNNIDVEPSEGGMVLQIAQSAANTTEPLVSIQNEYGGDIFSFTTNGAGGKLVNSDTNTIIEGQETLTTNDIRAMVASVATEGITVLTTAQFGGLAYDSIPPVNASKIGGTALSGKVGSNFDVFFQNGGADTTKIVDLVSAGGIASTMAYHPDAVTRVVGTDQGGILANLTAHDENYYSTGEVVGNGLEVICDIAASTITEIPQQVIIEGYYNGSAGHSVSMQARNYQLAAYETKGTMLTRTSSFSYSITLTDDNHDPVTGAMSIRLLHNAATYNASHRLHLDEVKWVKAVAVDQVLSDLANIRGQTDQMSFTSGKIKADMLLLEGTDATDTLEDLLESGIVLLNPTAQLGGMPTQQVSSMTTTDLGPLQTAINDNNALVTLTKDQVNRIAADLPCPYVSFGQTFVDKLSFALSITLPDKAVYEVYARHFTGEPAQHIQLGWFETTAGVTEWHWHEDVTIGNVRDGNPDPTLLINEQKFLYMRNVTSDQQEYPLVQIPGCYLTMNISVYGSTTQDPPVILYVPGRVNTMGDGMQFCLKWDAHTRQPIAMGGGPWRAGVDNYHELPAAFTYNLDGLVETMTFINGETWTYAYTNGKVTSVTRSFA